LAPLAVSLALEKSFIPKKSEFFQGSPGFAVLLNVRAAVPSPSASFSLQPSAPARRRTS
jgi:hypothetical protein